MNGDRAFIAIVAVFVAVLIWVWRVNHRKPRMRPLPRQIDPDRRRLRLAEIVGDRDDIGTWPGVAPLHPDERPLIHQTPPHDAVPQVTPCCSVPLPELPPGSHFSSEPSERTCGGEA